ncbi:DUF1183-domain-containing protein [Rickenella mellea]|uniref:Store-operated calcium entry-associated regulatory factor n=1 Tax=Rickenella mellea TaxID=50990 RepID=A0A4Y7PHE1_9AGAM|nr:DUF1183-domain-containing protein [Rickenella mellea]
MSRILLSGIRTLTFYNGEQTKASRRGPPVPQMVCIGKPCHLYQPEVIRCTNEGGEGVEVDWKCEADLPESLRFGRVQVSCEGWSGPGDHYVVKGSCGLEYRLVKISNLDDNISRPGWLANMNIATILFFTLWISVLLFLLYHLLKRCFGLNQSSDESPPPVDPPSNTGYHWHYPRPPGSYYSGRGNPPAYQPPPPYTDAQKPDSQGNLGGFTPGFWTGVGIGGLGATAAARMFGNREPVRPVATTREYDWERAPQNPTPLTSFSSNDRGEGPSNLGRMRRSTGLGGSSVR